MAEEEELNDILFNDSDEGIDMQDDLQNDDIQMDGDSTESTPKKKVFNRANFTPEEDEILKNIRDNEADMHWSEVATRLNRSVQSVVARYRLLTKKTRRKWTIEEDSTLKDLYLTFGRKWVMIARRLERKPYDVKRRFFELTQPQQAPKTAQKKTKAFTITDESNNVVDTKALPSQPTIELLEEQYKDTILENSISKFNEKVAAIEALPIYLQ